MSKSILFFSDYLSAPSNNDLQHQRPEPSQLPVILPQINPTIILKRLRVKGQIALRSLPVPLAQRLALKDYHSGRHWWVFYLRYANVRTVCDCHAGVWHCDGVCYTVVPVCKKLSAVAVDEARCYGQSVYQTGDEVHICVAANLLCGYFDRLCAYFVINTQSQKEFRVDEV